jgi:hypothetical protein
VGNDFDLRFKAYQDISCLIGAHTALRNEALSPEEMRETLLTIVGEWNDKGQLLVFLQAFVGLTQRLHAKVAESEGLSPEAFLETRYRMLMGE